MRTQCSWAMISTCFDRFYFIFLCVKNTMKFNVGIVLFLLSDHHNDHNLLLFAVSCLSFFNANGTELCFHFSIPFYIQTGGIVLYCGTLLLWVSTYIIFVITRRFFTYTYYLQVLTMVRLLIDIYIQEPKITLVHAEHTLMW